MVLSASLFNSALYPSAMNPSKYRSIVMMLVTSWT